MSQDAARGRLALEEVVDLCLDDILMEVASIEVLTTRSATSASAAAGTPRSAPRQRPAHVPPPAGSPMLGRRRRRASCGVSWSAVMKVTRRAGSVVAAAIGNSLNAIAVLRIGSSASRCSG